MAIMETQPTTLAERLRMAREAAGLTQQQLADQAKVSQGTIGNLEAGLRRKSAAIPLIARALGVDAIALVTGEGFVERAARPATSMESGNVVIDGPIDLSRLVRIAAYGNSPGAARGGDLLDDEREEDMEIPASLLGIAPKGPLVTARIAGDSMHPEIKDGVPASAARADHHQRAGARPSVSCLGAATRQALTRPHSTPNPPRRVFLLSTPKNYHISVDSANHSGDNSLHYPERTMPPLAAASILAHGLQGSLTIQRNPGGKRYRFNGHLVVLWPDGPVECDTCAIPGQVREAIWFMDKCHVQKLTMDGATIEAA